jgi:hypothetical protein
MLTISVACALLILPVSESIYYSYVHSDIVAKASGKLLSIRPMTGKYNRNIRLHELEVRIDNNIQLFRGDYLKRV